MRFERDIGMEKRESRDRELCEDDVPEQEPRPAEKAAPAVVGRDATTFASDAHTLCRFNFTGGIIR